MPKNINKTLQVTPDAPSTLGKEGREHWNILVKKLIADERVTDVDLSVLEIACDFWDEYRNAETATDRKRAADQYIKIVKMFGVTPESREKLSSAPRSSDKETKNSMQLSSGEGEYWGDLLDGIET